MTQPPNLVWCDVETTGLDTDVALVLEVGLIVTDGDLNVLEAKSHVIYQDLYLNDLSDWILATHGKNGLLGEVKNSTKTLSGVDNDLTALLRRSDLFPIIASDDDKPVLCGSTIGFDRAFLERDFPAVSSRLHYRSIDVSSIKELMKRWMPDEVQSNKETSQHRVIPDLYDSINELKRYREVLRWGLD